MINNTAASNQTLGNGSALFVVANEVAKIGQVLAANADHDEKGHQKTYAYIRDVYAFVKKVHKNPDYDADWRLECTIRQVRKPTKDQNEFAEYFNVLDGRFDTSKTVTFGGVQGAQWVRGRSSEKYARLLRWLYENDIAVEDVVDLINKFVHPNDPSKTKIEGIRQADIDRHEAKPRAKRKWTGTVKQDALAAPRSYAIPAEAVAGFTTHDGFGTLVWRRINGEVRVFCDGGATADAIVKVVTEAMAKPKDNDKADEAEPAEEALAA